MDKLLTTEVGTRAFLLGNEAIVRGALEAGMVLAATYPGTPSSEIGDTFFNLSRETDRYYFEYSTNEKVAMEVAMGAAVSGVRAMCFMKHVGLNVAADTLMTLAYAGVTGGMVVVTADDPGMHSSQNEQDNRLYAHLAHLPLLEPSNPQECKDMVREAFDLSQRLELPVLVRTTTRVNHMRGVVAFGPLPEHLLKVTEFKKNPRRFVCVPAIARTRRPVLMQRNEEARQIAETDERLNLELGSGSLGVVTSGASFNYVLDAITELELTHRVRVLKLGFTHPLPSRRVRRFLEGLERVLVVEELEPLLEQALKGVAFDAGLRPQVLGKASGTLSAIGEFSPEKVKAAVAELAGVSYAEVEVVDPPTLPSRPPNLCAGCPHRATFYAAKLVTRNRGVFNTDIGCYSLSVLPPLNMADILISMGSSINSAAGFSRSTPAPSIAFIGDSTFFHSGVTGIVNAVHNQHNMVVVVLDNLTTAMTGHQPGPGQAHSGSSDEAPVVSIEGLCRAAGVQFVEDVNPFDLKQCIETLERAVAHPGLAVVVSRGSCIFVNRKVVDARPVFTVDPDRCRYCGQCRDHAGCGELLHAETQATRSDHRIRSLPVGLDPVEERMPEKPEVAPCTVECPAHLCVQSYVTLIAAGRYEDAAGAVRERIPLPASVARVCHRPCEPTCSRLAYDSPLAINALKRFAMSFESRERVAEGLQRRLAEAPTRHKSVAVVGGGPAGLSAAHDLRLRGYEVSVYEAGPKLGGMLTLGIPAYRLPRDVLEGEIELIESLGLELHLSTRVGRDVTVDTLESRHDAVVLATGAWRGNRLAIANEDAKGVYDALSFLKAANLGRPLEVGKRVAVIGGGDAAVDAARVALRLGSEVTVYYRRTEQEMPAAADEVRAAREESVDFRFQITPVAVQAKAGPVTGLTMIRTDIGEPDRSGRRRPVPIKGSEHVVYCDTVIVAIGQRADLGFLPEDVARTARGTVEVDPETGAASRAGLFAAGDAVTGPKTVIHAIAAGQRAARGVDTWLSRRALEAPPDAPEEPVSAAEPEGAWEVAPLVGIALDEADPRSFRYTPGGIRGANRVTVRRRAAVARARSFDEVELGFSPEEATAEASRCLVCGQCAKCKSCIETFACPAFYVSATGDRIHIDENLCNGCGVCAQLCPNGAIRPRLVPLDGRVD